MVLSRADRLIFRVSRNGAVLGRPARFLRVYRNGTVLGRPPSFQRVSRNRTVLGRPPNFQRVFINGAVLGRPPGFRESPEMELSRAPSKSLLPRVTSSVSPWIRFGGYERRHPISLNDGLSFNNNNNDDMHLRGRLFFFSKAPCRLIMLTMVVSRSRLTCFWV